MSLLKNLYRLLKLAIGALLVGLLILLKQIAEKLKRVSPVH